MRDTATELNAASRKAAFAKFRNRRVEERALAIALISDANDAVISKKLDGTILSWNLGAESVFGYSAAEMIGQPITRLFPSDRLHEEPHFIARIRAGEKITHFETQRVRKDGRLIDVSLTISPIRDERGRIFALSTIARNISERKRLESVVRRSQVQLRTFIEQAPVALAMFDTSMRYVAVSDLWLCDYFLKGQSILGRSYYDVSPGIPDGWRELHRRALAGEVIRSQEDRFRRIDRAQWLRWEVRPWHTLEGAIGGVIIFSEDITDRKKAEEQQSIAALVYQASSEAMAVLDPKGFIISVNPAFTALTGYTADESIGMNIGTSVCQKEAVLDAVWTSLSATGSWKGELSKRRKNGEIFAVSMSINSIFGRDGSVDRHVALFNDITGQMKSRETIWRQANFDDLTDLPNRRMFKDRLDQGIKKASRSKRPLALVLLDLDRFKEVNDTLGHEKGDALLTEVAARLRGCVRESDTVARWGGDEFTLILGELGDVNAVARVAGDVLEKLRAPFELDGDPVYVSGSIGIAIYPSDAEDAERLIKNADQAMYESKYSGGNRIVYSGQAGCI